MAIAYCMGIFTILAVGQGLSHEAGVIEARTFKLVDENSKVRGVWGVAEGESVLYLYDKSQAEKICLRVGDNPLIRIYGGDGEQRRIAVQLSNHPLDGTHLVFFDQNGVERIVVRATNSSASLRVLDSRQQTRLWLKSDADDKAAIEVRDGGDNVVWREQSIGIKKIGPQ